MLLFTIAMHSQTGLVTYAEDTSTNFINPERGLYYYTSSKNGMSNIYYFLTMGEINDALNQNISLIWRQFRLDAFVNESNPNSSSDFTTLKNNMATDFALMRSKGVKCIVRFSYTDQIPNSPDATKAVILAQIDALKTVIQANEDVISSVEAGFIGGYGEWAYSAHFGDGTRANLELPANSQLKQDRVDIGQKLIGFSATNTGLTLNRMVAFRTPYFQQIVTYQTRTTGNPYDGQIHARTAAHNDCFLADATDMGTFESSPLSLDQDYLESQSKYTFTGGETCRNAHPPLDSFYNATNTLAKMVKYHFAYLNGSPDINPPPPSGISPNQYWNTANGGNIYGQIQRRLGYRFVLLNSNVTSNTLTINLKNVGFANMFNERKVYLILEDTSNPSNVYQVLLSDDPRRWDAGQSAVITKNLVGMTSTTGAIPTNKTYKLYLSLPDLNATLAASTTTNRQYYVRFGNNNSGSNVFWNANGKGWNNLFRSTFLSNTGTASRRMEDDQTIFDVTTYPNPFNNAFKFSISSSNDDVVTAKVFDMTGRLIDSKLFSITDAETIEIGTAYSAGIYNVVISQGENTKTLRIIKK